MGADNRTEERCGGEQTHSDTSLLSGKHVRNDTTSVSQRRGSKGTGEEPKNDDGPGILRTCDTGVESRESGVGSNEEDLAAKQLTQGSPEQWSNLYQSK
jgi:hypothetical protein